jgi:hypothetical protein
MARIAPKFPAIDAHTHIREDGIASALDVMDSVGLKAMVNLTALDGEREAPLEEKITAYLGKHRRRFGVMMMMHLDTIDERGWGRREADRLTEAVELGACGLKELKRLGLEVRDKSGKLIPVDDPRIDPVWKRCGELGVPVAIHTSDPLQFHRKLTLRNERVVELQVHPDWYFLKPGLPSKMEVLEQRNRVIAKHKKTKFICVHVANFPEDLVTVARWLDMYPNMYIDLAARFVEIGRHHPEMVRNFFLHYQDRILFGTDTGISAGHQMLGVSMPSDKIFVEWSDYKETFLFPYFDSMYRYLETDDYYIPSPTPVQGQWPIHGIALPDKVLRKVYSENAKRTIPGLG